MTSYKIINFETGELLEIVDSELNATLTMMAYYRKGIDTDAIEIEQ